MVKNPGTDLEQHFKLSSKLIELLKRNLDYSNFMMTLTSQKKVLILSNSETIKILFIIPLNKVFTLLPFQKDFNKTKNIQ